MKLTHADKLSEEGNTLAPHIEISGIYTSLINNLQETHTIHGTQS